MIFPPPSSHLPGLDRWSFEPPRPPWVALDRNEFGGPLARARAPKVGFYTCSVGDVHHTRRGSPNRSPTQETKWSTGIQMETTHVVAVGVTWLEEPLQSHVWRDCIGHRDSESLHDPPEKHSP